EVRAEMPAGLRVGGDSVWTDDDGGHDGTSHGESRLERREPPLDFRQLGEGPGFALLGGRRRLAETARIPGRLRGVEEQVQLVVGRQFPARARQRLPIQRKYPGTVLDGKAVEKGRQVVTHRACPRMIPIDESGAALCALA